MPDHATPDPALPASPLLCHKDYVAPSVFTPEQLLREARRQKAIDLGPVPVVCVLDPDGDIVAYVRAEHHAVRSSAWACYHTELYTFTSNGIDYGIVGGVVGAAFAVLVAEELFASGCRLLISITSAGQIVSVGRPPYFVLIERALRDEGTSYHYLAPSRYSELRPELAALFSDEWQDYPVAMRRGASWTTDAPFRETAGAIAAAQAEGILAVEMEAAALYACAAATGRAVICFAHVTNQMGTIEGDFEKGVAQGSYAALEVLHSTVSRWLQSQREMLPDEYDG